MNEKPSKPSGKAIDRPERAWQRMLSGRRLDLLDPSPMDIEIEDIAHGLSRVARWNGQTTGSWAYSVAQHSVLVEHLVGRLKGGLPVRWRLAALLHDAPEYVIGDMITPFKAIIGPDYKTVEAHLMQAIHIRFGLPGMLPDTITKLIKRADRVAAYLEATQLAGFDPTEARTFFGKPTVATDLTITPATPEAAQGAYLERFRALGG
jgi:5'-deoxynucleotidase YfbR-like HD superfamily hydrolase